MQFICVCRATYNSCSASVTLGGSGSATAFSAGIDLAVSGQVPAVGERRGCSLSGVVGNAVRADLGPEFIGLHMPELCIQS